MLSMRSLLCKSSENHYILYFTAKMNLESSGCGHLAVENSASLSLAWETILRASGKHRTRPSRETIPLAGKGQGAIMVHSLWRGVEGVDKRSFCDRSKRAGQLPYRANFNRVALGGYFLLATTPIPFRKFILRGFGSVVASGDASFGFEMFWVKWHSGLSSIALDSGYLPGKTWAVSHFLCN